jgi:hypothetical protein
MAKKGQASYCLLLIYPNFSHTSCMDPSFIKSSKKYWSYHIMMKNLKYLVSWEKLYDYTKKNKNNTIFQMK